MATILRFPVCSWQSGKKAFTVRMVDDGYDEIIVTAESVKEAVSQMKEHLSHLSKTGSWKLFSPDFFNAELRVLKFSILPEYKVGHRSYPCRESVPFKMPCITGKRECGTPIGFLPVLGLFFDFHREDSFEKLAIHIAQRFLSGKTPRELSRFLRPAQVEMDQITITLKDSTVRDDWERDLAPLTQLAEPIGSNRLRSRTKTWERDAEVTTLVRLLGEESGNLCLLGPSGCGKTSVLIEAARKIERSEINSNNKRRFWLSSGARIIAGMRWLGEWEERLEESIRLLGQIDGVLCIENLSELTQLGGGTPETSLAAFLLPYMKHRELRLIVEATPEELEACERSLPGLTDQFKIVTLSPYTDEEARNILNRAAGNHSRNDHVDFSPAAASRTFALFKRFQPYVAFPGKILTFMSGVVDDVLNDGSDTDINQRRIDKNFSKYTGLPESLTHDDIPFDYDALVDFLQSKVIAQKDAVFTVSRAVAKFASGLNDPDRPISVMLCCGPTGVGKTQLIRALGEYLFPNQLEKDRIIRLDMSEYAGPDASERLLGKAYGEPSDLIRRIRANPFSILLLDEIEKAGDEVFDIFLNVFEEGRLTDPLGRVTVFQSCLIAMTSNLGSGNSGMLGFSEDGAREDSIGKVDRSAITGFFRPEFFNRLDQVLYFNPLNREAIEEITRKEIDEISQRAGLAERGLHLEVDQKLIADLARKGFDPVYGARPLQRAIEENLILPLARWLSRENIPDKATIFVKPDGDDVSFRTMST